MSGHEINGSLTCLSCANSVNGICLMGWGRYPLVQLDKCPDADYEPGVDELEQWEEGDE